MPLNNPHDSDAHTRAAFLKNLESPDPVAADEAANYFINQNRIPLTSLLDLVHSGEASHYKNHFLSRVLGHHWKITAQPLVSIINDGHWGAKTNAAECFRFIPKYEISEALVQVITGKSMDAARCAIRALGFLGADEWGFKISEEALRSGYALEKLGPYALEAFTRFLAKETNDYFIYSRLSRIEEMIKAWPDEDPEYLHFHKDYVVNVLPECTSLAADGITRRWLTHENEMFREFGAIAIGHLRLTRSVKPLAARLLDPNEEPEVRYHVARALGRIGGRDANQALTKVLPSLRERQGSEPDHWWGNLRDGVIDALSVRFYEADVEGDVHNLIEEMLAGSSFAGGMARYALGWFNFGYDTIVEGLSSSDSFIRGAAALGLARSGNGEEIIERLNLFIAESSDSLERLMAFAGLIICGQTDRLDEFHTGLSGYRYAPSLQYQWQREFLYALSLGGDTGRNRAQAWAALMNVNLDRCLVEINALLRRKGVESAVRTEVGGALAESKTQSPKRASGAVKDPIRVFVSYSHQDEKYLEKGYLLDYLSGLEREGFEFWYDRQILASEQWDARIKQEIARSDIALVLVSQPFLNSDYCRTVEVEDFIRLRTEKGLLIYPIIISACSWKDHEWLRSTQFQPRDDKTIERNYQDKGKRDELFLKIYEELKELGKAIRSKRKQGH